MDTSEESSLALRPGPTPAPEPTCSHIPQEQLHVPASHSLLSLMHNQAKNTSQEALPGEESSLCLLQPPQKIAAAGMWQLSLHAERGPPEKAPGSITR